MEPTLITLKRKAILSVVEYCLDNKLEFSVKDKAFGHDEFELKLFITDIKKALSFGYFARENKIEIPGVSEAPKARTRNTKPVADATEEEVEEKEEVVPAIAPLDASEDKAGGLF